MPSSGSRSNYVVETLSDRSAKWRSVEAAVVYKRRLARTVVAAECQSREMDVKEKQRVAITFCCKVDISASKTVELIRKAYGDAAVSRTAIFEWHKRFREGRESVKDDEHSGRPSTC
jgi:hypothetical protein